MMAIERLQKILASAGIASRRKSEAFILEGRVTVNGRVVLELGSKADAAADHIKVDGKLIEAAGPVRVFVYYKPRGILTTASDPLGRPCVGDLCRKLPGKVFHVGRLDTNTEGLLVLTNDGDLANLLMHPSQGCPRVYKVKVKGMPSANTLKRLQKGIVLDGFKTAPCVLELTQEGKNAWLRVELREGRSHQIKKMFESAGHLVPKITRVKIGPLSLSGLAPGRHRELNTSEVQALRDSLEHPPRSRTPSKRGKKKPGSPA